MLEISEAVIARWTTLVKQLEANDNILLDTLTISNILADAQWLNIGSAEWLLAVEAMSGNVAAGIDLVDRSYPGCNIYCERVWHRASSSADKAWGVVINPPTGIRFGQKAFGSSQGRAMVVALLKLDIATATSQFYKQGQTDG